MEIAAGFMVSRYDSERRRDSSARRGVGRAPMDDRMAVLEALAAHVSGPEARRLAEGLPREDALPLLRATEVAEPGDFYAATGLPRERVDQVLSELGLPL